MSIVENFPQAQIVFDAHSGGQRLDLRRLRCGPADAHLYCCGPSGMLDAFVAVNAAARRATPISSISRPTPKLRPMAAIRWS
jgi:ferredoxin-NADP reductase